MITSAAMTLDTTYALQLNNADGNDADWHFISQVEYTDAGDCEALVRQMYGGAFAKPGMYRVIKIERTVMQ